MNSWKKISIEENQLQQELALTKRIYIKSQKLLKALQACRKRIKILKKILEAL